MIKIANKNSRINTTNKESFEGSNLYAKDVKKCYVVFSYGLHFPLYIFKEGEWYENESKYSSTTAKHKYQSRPDTDKPFILKSTKEMIELLR